MTKIKKLIISLVLFFPLIIGGQDNRDNYMINYPIDATAVLTDIIAEVVDLMSADNGANTLAIKEKIVDKTINLFDFNRITALAIGFPWKHATAEQKIQLSREFKHKLINIYYSTLVHAKDAKVEIKQNPSIKNEGREIVIQSKVISSADAKNPIAIDYFLYKTEEGYKIYNINIQGVSLVTVYRGKFSEIIQGKGIDGLIEVLKMENSHRVSEKKNCEIDKNPVFSDILCMGWIK